MRLHPAPPADAEEKRYIDNYRRLVREHYVAEFEWRRFEDVPWAPLRKPVAEARVALIATVGAHRRGDAPFDISNPNGDPSFRRIPDTCSTADLTLSHEGYDTKNCLADINCVFPLDRLHDLVGEARVGSASPFHFSCMGYIPHVDPLLQETAPAVARELREAGVNAAVCVPT
ncbi:MAG: glycine/sarcosine/betaine reductase selenoprotein B family protein [Acidobacteriota bacterium]